MRYTQARAVTRRMQTQMRRRSRGVATAADGGLSAAPGERGVLSMVLSAHVPPAEPQGSDLALHGVREGKPIRRRMACVVQIEGLRGVGIDAHRRLGRDVDQPWRGDGPLGARAIEANRRRL